jgi:hypothetical protein
VSKKVGKFIEEDDYDDYEYSRQKQKMKNAEMKLRNKKQHRDDHYDEYDSKRLKNSPDAW